MHPDRYTISEHMLDVGHGHTLYIHDWGNKNSPTPILFLHGGPGSQSKDKHKLPFDPTSQRVIFHDQRGCGRSTPLGQLHYNTTQDLVADITKIVDFLGIDQFILTGGSWGSALALYYAITEPGRITALVISGVFTASQAEIDWLDKGLFRTHFPDVWERYLTATPEQYRGDPTKYHAQRILGKDSETSKLSAMVYSELEGSLLCLDDTHLPAEPNEFDSTSTILEMYYLNQRCFLPDRFILENTHKIKVPVHIVQGRYDFVCPPETAYALSASAPDVHLVWVSSGHHDEHENLTAKRLIYKTLVAQGSPT